MIYRVPIAHSYAYVVVARARRGRVLGYFYLTRRPLVSAELAQLRPDRADVVKVVAELPITAQHWPLVASVSGWDASAWPVPGFYDSDSGMLRLYDDRLHFTGERPASEQEITTSPRDGQAGGELWAQQLGEMAARRFGGAAALAS
jgi:hypothetical protein